VVREGLDGRLGYEDMDLALDSVESDWVVCCVWCEDSDSRAGGEGVYGGLVGIGVSFVVRGVGFEGGVKAVVDLGDIFVKMFAWKSNISMNSATMKLRLAAKREEWVGSRTNSGEFRPRSPNHRQLPNFPPSSQIEHRQAHNADLFI
jgi:hypothetical protein